MKHLVTLVVSVLVLASCSTPKYTYNFDYYDYNSGRKKAEAEKVVADTETKPVLTEASPVEEASPLRLTPDDAVASTGEIAPAPVAKPAAKKYTEMSKTEKKEFRKTVKKEIKTYLKAKKGDGNVGNETQALDYNLKMAIIFGAVALTLSFFGGVNSVFWIASVIALVIGVVFFIKWIAEQ
jgi:hypothetical protein